METKKYSNTLQKIARDLRKEAEEIDNAKAVKCAQALIAAYGLSKLKERIQGEVR